MTLAKLFNLTRQGLDEGLVGEALPWGTTLAGGPRTSVMRTVMA